MTGFWKRNPVKRKHRAEVKRQVANYNEGRRLMRVGDGYDEFAGNNIAYKAREKLRDLGYDIDGTRTDLIPIDRRA